MNELIERLENLKAQLNLLEESFDEDSKKQTVQELQAKTTAPDFWNNDVEARSIMQQLSELQHELEEFNQLKEQITGLIELATISQEDSDTTVEKEMTKEVAQLEKRFHKLKLKSYLNGPFDNRSAIISIHSGQGGTEAMDWASMLMRMYMRYFERKEWNYELIDQVSGEEAGIKTAIFKVNHPFAFGYLKMESGTHRLVRQSPFNADNLRQTSFAGVEVLPMLEGKRQIEVKDEELEWQFYRSGGAGGQNVNKVNTAVRLKHLPTGIVVTSQSSRTQLGNRENALDLLQSKLWQRQQEQESSMTKEIKGEHKIAGWGNQIRSYVLHPYQMVKDNRTGVETSDSQGVLDGDLDQFIEAEIALT